MDEGRLKKDNSEILLYQQVVRKRQKFRRWVERVCVPSVPELRRAILEKGHRSSLSIHLGATKMY